MIIPIFIPHAGCKERCTFCDQGISGGDAISPNEITLTIESHLKTSASTNHEVAFYGGTFTALSKTLQIKLLDIVKPYIESGKIDSIRISTRPDAIEFEWIKFLKNNYHLKVVELGIQSFNLNILKKLGRNYSFLQIEEAMNCLKSLQIITSLHLMIGCPDETENDRIELIDKTLQLKPDFVRIHPLLILKNTELAKQYAVFPFELLSLDEAVKICADFVVKFEAHDIKIIRIGLQPNEILLDSIIAGPYHSAFGELVKSEIVYSKLHKHLRLISFDHLKDLQFDVPEKLLSQFKGQKSNNIKRLISEFKLSNEPKVMIHSGRHENQIGIHYTSRLTQCRQVEFF